MIDRTNTSAWDIMVTSSDDAHVAQLVETVQRLCAEFPALSIGDVLAMVVECRQDLSVVPSGAAPDLIERLARVRLAR
jgi:fructose-1,6-bisphosphatase/sedoheptulose 1,7-bisphosphatase-like protein